MTVGELRILLDDFPASTLVVCDMEEIGFAHLERVKLVLDEASGDVYCNLISDTAKNRKGPF